MFIMYRYAVNDDNVLYGLKVNVKKARKLEPAGSFVRCVNKVCFTFINPDFLQ